MSIRLKLFLKLSKRYGLKGFFSNTEDNFDEKLRYISSKQKDKLKTKVLKGNHHEIINIDGSRVYRIKRDDKKKKKALFYLFGGGFVAKPGNDNFKLINRILENIDCECIFPDYPLYPEYKLSEIVGWVNKVYERVLKDYRPEDIVFLGFSSGASLCMYLFNYRNMLGLEPNYPDKMILSSPVAEMPPDADTLAKMKEIDSKDYVLPYRFIDEIGKAMTEDDFPNLASTTKHDLSGFPPIKLMIGENEIFYAYLPLFKEVEKKYNLDIEYIIGKEMPHCWPYIIFTPEGQDGFKKIINFIKE
ncbi:MAG: alpha/beta hydrolase [Tissierellia bacterium]|nr:alpha/beta hydrolase [Tissierellia bacterium]